MRHIKVRTHAQVKSGAQRELKEESTRMGITDSFGTGMCGRDNDDENTHQCQRHRRRLLTISGTVLLAGATFLSPVFATPAYASSLSTLSTLEAGAVRAALQVDNYSTTQSAATVVVTQPGSSEYRRGFRQGFRTGRSEGWADAKRECKRDSRTRLQSVPDNDYDRGYAEGYERGYTLGFDLASEKFC
jgi:hypothetical protein